MTDESAGLGERAKGFLKDKVGGGEPALATEVGGKVAAMREALRAFGEGDIDRFLSVFAEDVEWIAPAGGDFPGSGTLKGREAVSEQFVGEVSRSFAAFGFEPDRYLEAEDEGLVVALGRFAGEPVQGASRLDVPAVLAWEFAGDHVARVQIYADAAAFPGVVSEEQHKKTQSEGEGEGDSESRPSSESEGESREGPAGEERHGGSQPRA